MHDGIIRKKQMMETKEVAKRWSVRRCLKDFSQCTSMHGAAKVGDSDKHVLARLFWLLLVLSAAGQYLVMTAMVMMITITTMVTLSMMLLLMMVM